MSGCAQKNRKLVLHYSDLTLYVLHVQYTGMNDATCHVNKCASGINF